MPMLMNVIEFLKNHATLMLLAFILFLLIGYSTYICIKWFKEKIQTVLMISNRSAYVISISCVMLSYYCFNIVTGLLYFFFWLSIKTYDYTNECDASYGLWASDKESREGDCSSDKCLHVAQMISYSSDILKMIHCHSEIKYL